jgi:hypothetical protein
LIDAFVLLALLHLASKYPLYVSNLELAPSFFVHCPMGIHKRTSRIGHDGPNNTPKQLTANFDEFLSIVPFRTYFA